MCVGGLYFTLMYFLVNAKDQQWVSVLKVRDGEGREREIACLLAHTKARRASNHLELKLQLVLR